MSLKHGEKYQEKQRQSGEVIHISRPICNKENNELEFSQYASTIPFKVPCFLLGDSFSCTIYLIMKHLRQEIGNDMY